MAKIHVENTLEALASDLRVALERAVKEVMPGASFDARTLYKAFVRQAHRKCSTWESVPDRCVEKP
jgi:hypothetical protein